MSRRSSAPRDPREARLKTERERLEKLAQESDHVRVEVVDRLPGSEPERYRVTFLCKGIVAIDASRRPVYGDKHVVEIHCDESFPADVPRLRWVTPIWHPNIQHFEPKGVCVNKHEWLGGMRLDDLCRLMFEMVQYKNYHARATPPYPLDMEVAQWVLQFAEPNGIVDKQRNIFVDDKPFVRPTVPHRPMPAPPAPPRKVKLLSSPSPPPPPPPQPGGVRILKPVAPPAQGPGGGPAGPAKRITILKKS